MLGKDNTIGGRVIFGAELVEPARVKVTVYADKVMLGSLKDGVPFEKVKEIAELFDNSGIPTSSTEEIEKSIWGKVLYNCALNALSCLLEVNYGKLLENPQAKTIMEDTVRELFKVLQVKKVVVDWNEADEYIEELFEHLIPATYDHFSSMLQDIRTGKKTEIDALNGKIVAMAEEMKLDLPVNRVITSLVKAKKVTPTLDN